VSRAILFVTACSRSGTTALVRLLNQHAGVGIGMERFKFLYSKHAETDLSRLFEPARFFDFRPGDTNLLPDVDARWRKHYDAIAAKHRAGTLSVIGDKALATPGIVRALTATFPRARWIFIFRDLEGVASSFVGRADNPADVNWPPEKRHESALSDWRGAFEAVEGLLGDGRMFPVRYERLFAGDRSAFRAMFGFLEVEVEDLLERRFDAMTKDWDVRKSKDSLLGSSERAWLASRRPTDLEHRFLEASEAAVRNHAR
jgi:hypothetical protein